MKKTHLFMVFIAFCMILYGISAVYASISTSSLAPEPSKEKSTYQPSEYNAPMNPPSPPQVYGDPIQDPRPKSMRPIRI